MRKQDRPRSCGWFRLTMHLFGNVDHATPKMLERSMADLSVYRVQRPSSPSAIAETKASKNTLLGIPPAVQPQELLMQFS